jgi:hypothetical protein
VSWHRSVIAALRRLRQEDDEFKDSLNYIARLSLKKKKMLIFKSSKENGHTSGCFSSRPDSRGSLGRGVTICRCASKHRVN